MARVIPFGEATPRAGNDSGGGQPGRILKCKGWETDPNAYIYFITQAPVWESICDVIGEPGWKTHPDYAKPGARLPRLNEIFGRIEQWTMTKTKFEAMDILNQYDIPCGPILSMKELAEDQSLRATGTIVEVDHPARGKYLSVGNPIKLSDSPADVKRSPLLGEHTDEILSSVLGYSAAEIEAIRRQARQSRRRKRPRRNKRFVNSRSGAFPSAASIRPDTEEIPMRIVVHGQEAFGKAVLEKLLARGENVVGVFCAPDKEGRPQDPLKLYALEKGIPVHQPKSWKTPEALELMKSFNPMSA